MTRRHSLESFARRACVAVSLLAWGPPAALTAQTPGGQPTALNFVNARLADVIRSLASMLGVNVVMSGVPEDRRITFSTTAPVRPTDLGPVLEAILESNHLVLVQKGPVAQVMPVDSAPPTGVIRVGLESSDPPPLGLVTQLVPLQSIRAEEGAAALRQVAGPLARIEPVARSNALLVTDRGVNVARYLELLRRLDERPAGEAGLRTYVVPLKYANAEDLAASLAQLFGTGIVGGRAASLSDRSLSRNLGLFRERENETFQARRDVPLPPTPATSMSTLSGGTAGVPRDTGTGGVAPPGALVGQTTVVPNPPTNSLIIRTVAPNFPLLRETIEALDTRPAQVLFEVTVAEITLTRGEEFGIDWFAQRGHVTGQFGAPILPDSTAAVSDFLVRVVSLGRVDVRALLRAIATRSDVRVLSTPEILAVNNREANILVGNKVPFVASTRLGDFALDRSVQYQDVGTSLSIIPTINSDDHVSVQILQEVSTLTSQTLSSALGAPVISTREASTRAIIRDGQTVVIGGLIGNSRDRNESGIPLLKDIPLLGNLFKRQTLDRSRTELAIFVTPFIVRSDAEADTIRERVRDRMNEPSGRMLDSIPYNAPKVKKP